MRTLIATCLLVPGGSLLLSNYRNWAFAIPFIGFIWTYLLSITRLTVTPNGFILLLIGLFLIHMISFIFGYIYFLTHKTTTEKSINGLTLLFTTSLIVALLCHIYKATWFGFAFYHIPSSSMEPTLLPGDIVLVDTWRYNKEEVKAMDLIVTRKKSNSFVLAKRVSKTRKNLNTYELFITGDNTLRSIDSRRFGWIDKSLVIGRIEFIWFSFNTSARNFIKTK